MITAEKLTKAEAGRLGANARWAKHVPTVVRLADLDPRVQAAVRALVAADKAARADTPKEAA